MGRLALLVLSFLTSHALAQTSVKSEPVEAKVVQKERISEIRAYLAPFKYDRNALRDPFEVQRSNEPLIPAQTYGPFLALQNYRLNSYKLKGLLWDIERPIAIFRGPDGRDYRLGIKDYIGENFGYIATIREKEVVIIQTIEENDKKYSTTKVVFLE